MFYGFGFWSGGEEMCDTDPQTTDRPEAHLDNRQRQEHHHGFPARVRVQVLDFLDLQHCGSKRHVANLLDTPCRLG